VSREEISMERDPERFVPKVHPASRPIELDDPLDLNATMVPGDVELMFRSVVQEYAWMGWGTEPILGLFRDPFYPALHGLWLTLGEAETRTRIEEVLARTGVIHFRATVIETEPDEGDDEPDLVPIGIPAVLLGPCGRAPGSNGSAEALEAHATRREGDHHVQGL
jgi:hypothetical protein